MEKRASRVSESQWSILLEFLEQHPSLAKARGYNNSAKGRAESARLWQEVANRLNAEALGTTKTPKDWSIYVSNYKSKIKKIIADINMDATATGGGPPQGSNLSETDSRFLAILGPGFGQTAPQVRVNPFPDTDPIQPSTLLSVDVATPVIHLVTEEEQEQRIMDLQDSDRSRSPIHDQIDPLEVQAEVQLQDEINRDAAGPSLPRIPRQRRYRTRPLAPLDEARRILSEVEMQRAAADAASASALHLIGQNLGRLADAAEKYVSHITNINNS